MLFSVHNLLALAASAAAVATSSTKVIDKFEKSHGFGVQRLERHQLGHKTMRAQACPGVTELRFAEAVQDNFASVEQQTNWVAPGQRYWVNDELWGGVGFPIFVFIGGEGGNCQYILYYNIFIFTSLFLFFCFICSGEWEESCSTLTPSGLYMYELAQEHQGLLLNVEHRFYGDSFPFNDSSTAR